MDSNNKKNYFQIVGWDEKAFYVEQKFVQTRDQFICAIVYVKQNFIGITPDEILKHTRGREIERPQLPEEVKKWIQCNEISSANLKKSC